MSVLTYESVDLLEQVRPELLQYCVDVPKEGQQVVDFGTKIALLRAAQVTLQIYKR